MNLDFERIAVVNRGEPAMRLIHAVREFNHEHGTALRSIALFTEPDRGAMFVREADSAVLLGPAQVQDPDTHQLKSSYLDYARLERALTQARAEAAWVGWGFVAEHAAFADLCRELGIVFIGPDGDAMRRVGDKIASKLLAEQHHIPVAPWSGGPVETVESALQHGQRLGYPLLIKATAGGGGHGIRLVRSEKHLPAAFESARTEAFKAFGDPTVFLEQLLPNSRHVEVQVIADNHGTTWAVGVRDCTVQRRQQKILEESPSPALSSKQDEILRSAAVRLSAAAGYRNAGTVEFLYQPQTGLFSFMEMNTRLQVEHPVTECTTGLDLVKLQIQVARGLRLQGKPPVARGHAIELRLNAEDAENGFAPAPGVIERFRIVAGPGVRVDTGVAEGDSVPADFDSMIAKIIAHGQTRSEALARLQRTLSESVVVIRGGTSNKAFLLQLLSDPEIRRGDFDTAWLDRLAGAGAHIPRRHANAALVQAAIESYESQLAVEQKQFYASALRGRPQVRSEVGLAAELRYRGHPYCLKTYRLGPRQYRIDVDGSRIVAELERIDNFEHWLTAFNHRFHVISAAQGVTYSIEVDGVAHRVDRDDGGIVHATAPAVVVSVAVKPGDTVQVGDRLAVLEAMKMEMQVVASFTGTVRQVMAIPNVQVDAGAPLLQIDPTPPDEKASGSERVSFSAPPISGESRGTCAEIRESLEQFRQLMLGFDVDARHTSRLLENWKKNLPAEEFETRETENEILQIFVDICSLFQRDPEVTRVAGEEPSAEVYLFSFLRSLDPEGEGLPPSFVAALGRALAHYGVEDLRRSPLLEQSLLWIYKSHQRIQQQVGVVLALLERRLQGVEHLRRPAEESFGVLLERLVAITNGVFPAVSDLAREVRYRCFDLPLLERARAEIYDKAEQNLAYLSAHPDALDREERVRQLVECPQPLVGLIAARFGTAGAQMRKLLLESITRRYYRIRNLESVRCCDVAGRCCIFAEYEYDGKRIHLFSMHVEYAALAEAAHSLSPALAAVPAGADVVVDFYLSRPDSLPAPDVTQQEVSAALSQVAFPRPLRRIVVEVSGPNHLHEASGMQHFTYRQASDNRYEEEKLYRGIHPMLGKRLHLWRLSNFDIERLPSAEDVYVIHAVARENVKDERLFVCAEVRDITTVRDENGRVLQMPHLERMCREAMAAIRQFQWRRAANQRLHWNRIFLYVWPPLYLQRDELRDIVRRMAPAAEGLGLEQVVVRVRIPSPATGELRDMVVRISSPGGRNMLVTFRPADQMQPIKPLAAYEQKVVRMRQRGLIYPYEIVKMLTPPAKHTRAEFPAGDFVEHDLDSQGQLVAVTRPYGQNRSNIIVGVIRNFTSRYPEGMSRVLLLGDPSKDLGALAESECRRIIAALDLAERLRVPLEWFAVSAGAKISMDSGVENMDWIARVLRRIVQFTQAGGEINLLINGINVGAQPYWNAEATMLMHTRGILVMTPKAAMVLTGKRALDYSGGISAEDNQGIGGYDRVMGINGQAQYWARDIDEACHILFRHYEHCYVAPGERFPRRAETSDPMQRDVRNYPHSDHAQDGFPRVGDIFSDVTNPGRKKSFDIRKVMMAAIDQDHPPLERWAGMRAAETAVVWDAHLGGCPVCLIGIESRVLPRLGFVSADGPDQWTSGTLFPQSSKKVARALNAASNNRPVVILANLSGFDGSPESMRRLQLEYGAEIGRAVVNFRGPVIFCVISRFHGGAYVVFSRALNEQLEVSALEGSYASVIGGAPAAAVVFASEVEARVRNDERMQPLAEALAHAAGAEKGRLRAQWDEMFKLVHSEKLGEMAAEFDRVHDVQRALRVGALHRIIAAAQLRPYLIDAVERGIAGELDRCQPEKGAAVAVADAA